jgi:tetratricopeptide (TPR) repeat protein
MLLSRLTAISLACLMPLGASAQRNPNIFSRQVPCELQIHVSYEDDHPAERLLQVDLLNSNGGTSGTSFTDDRGYATFQVTAGNYRVRVSGPSIVENTSSYFSINDREMTHVEYVSVRRDPANSTGAGAAGTVSVADLNVPDAAAKEFKKGNEALEKNNLSDARKHFDKAIQLYPNYASAYFGEGILEYKSGDKQKARADFEKTLTLNDHFVPAYFNLAKMAAAETDYQRASELLGKASTAEPLNPEGLMLTAQVDLLLKNYDGALNCTKKVHAMQQHQPYAVVHYIAARAYLYKEMPNEAAEQYKEFLEEVPLDSRAPKVRQEMATLIKSQGLKMTVPQAPPPPPTMQEPAEPMGPPTTMQPQRLE